MEAIQRIALRKHSTDLWEIESCPICPEIICYSYNRKANAKFFIEKSRRGIVRNGGVFLLQKGNVMDKKRKFLLEHPKIYDIYAVFKIFIYKIKRIGKSGDCRMFGYCKNKGCFKNRTAKRFKLAGALGCKCYESIEENNATTEK